MTKQELVAYIRSALDGKEVYYPHITFAVAKVGDCFNDNIEKLMIDLINFDGQFNLTFNSDFPSSASVEDLTKGVALQVLVENTGAKYRDLVEKFLELPHGRLHSIAKAVKEKYLN